MDHTLVRERTEHDRTVDLGTHDMCANWIRKVFQVSHTSQLQLYLEEIITILDMRCTINEVEHWRREHFFCEVLVV